MNAVDAVINSVEFARRKHGEERDKLIKAALFAVDRGVPLHRVAEAAGVHRTTLYRWIKTSTNRNPKEKS